MTKITRSLLVMITLLIVGSAVAPLSASAQRRHRHHHHPRHHRPYGYR